MNYYGVPDLAHLDQWVTLGVPFEYQDFMLPDILDREDEVRRRIRSYRAADRERKHDVVHGPFLDITIHSSDSGIRAASDRRIRQVCDIAMELEAKALVLHTNLIPNFYTPSYRQGWVDRNEAYLRQLLRDYPGLTVYMENMFDEEPDSLVTLAGRMEGERFGICLDIAHANISRSGIGPWLDACGPYTAHYHLNDNHGRIDAHLPLGAGGIPWNQVLPRLNGAASRLIEVDSLEKYNQSLSFLDSIINTKG